MDLGQNNLLFLLQFSIDDFKGKYAGSLLGMVWAFIQPITTIILYWFVFQVAFGSAPVDNHPFILWLIAGLLPWFFFSDAISNATTGLTEYSYLVKKVLFNVDIIPLAKVISNLLIQMVLISFSMIIYALLGYYPSVGYLGIFVYLIYMLILVIGIVFFTSSLYVFFKDAMQIIAILLQIIFWMTPIVWQLNNMPEIIKIILGFNPLYYIVEGYRSVLVYGNMGSFDWKMIVYYWGIAAFVFFFGVMVFKRCKTHFADVL